MMTNGIYTKKRLGSRQEWEDYWENVDTIQGAKRETEHYGKEPTEYPCLVATVVSEAFSGGLCFSHVFFYPHDCVSLQYLEE